MLCAEGVKNRSWIRLFSALGPEQGQEDTWKPLRMPLMPLVSNTASVTWEITDEKEEVVRKEELIVVGHLMQTLATKVKACVVHVHYVMSFANVDLMEKLKVHFCSQRVSASH